MMEMRGTRRLCLGLLVVLMLIALAGCGSPREDLSKMTPEEEQKVKDSAVQYIKKTYNKELVIKDITKGRVVGDYSIHGTIKDGKDTPVYVGVGVNSPDGDGFDDSYVSQLFTNELEPRVKELLDKSFDLRVIEKNSFFYGYKDGVKRKYTTEIPSVWEVLQKGDKSLGLRVSFEIYGRNGSEQTAISSFLQELKKMNFNDIGIMVDVYDKKLKSMSKKESSDHYLIESYDIFNSDIQTMNINNLEPFKTTIKK